MRGSNFINGSWSDDKAGVCHPVINPATGEGLAKVAWATPEQVESAIGTASTAFQTWGLSSKQERIDLLDAIVAGLTARQEELGETISKEMGFPIDAAVSQQAGGGIGELRTISEALAKMDLQYAFTAEDSSQQISLEPVGVAALITPWNWPLAQVTLKLGAALAAGCTCVLKPSEMSPLVAILLAEVMDDIGAPAGVFNLVQGDGATVGAQLTAHSKVDMVSFTGSTRAGRAISISAAQTIKRVALELGGKSPSIVFADADLDKAIRETVGACFHNTGQNCNAPTRLLVQRPIYQDVLNRIKELASSIHVGMPQAHGDHLGPLISQTQMERVQAYIEGAMEEGARLVTGGPGRPDGLDNGWFTRPTVFADVDTTMSIWREEIFGPVLAITPFDTEEDAVTLANDTEYGLAAYLSSSDPDRCQRVARQLRAGMIEINGASLAPGTPFGGMKQSGNGREGGKYGIEDFLEAKAIAGWP